MGADPRDSGPAGAEDLIGRGLKACRATIFAWRRRAGGFGRQSMARSNKWSVSGVQVTTPPIERPDQKPDGVRKDPWRLRPH